MKGIAEGLQKYSTTHNKTQRGKNIVMLVSHQVNIAGAPISLSLLANGLSDKGYSLKYNMESSNNGETYTTNNEIWICKKGKETLLIKKVESGKCE